jgi:hypothetical protein
MIGDGDHPFVGTIERRVEDGLLVFGAAFDGHLAEGGVPLGAGLGGQLLQVNSTEQIAARRPGANVTAAS